MRLYTAVDCGMKCSSFHSAATGERAREGTKSIFTRARLADRPPITHDPAQPPSPITTGLSPRGI